MFFATGSFYDSTVRFIVCREFVIFVGFSGVSSRGYTVIFLVGNFSIK